jgi:hypothetical protein
VLFDHDAKVSGDSARFADFLAAGGQEIMGAGGQEIMGGLREGLGRLGYGGVTHPEARPRPDDLGALLNAMLFSSPPRRAGPISATSYDPVRQIAEDHAIGNLDVGVGWPALIRERHLDGTDCPAGTGLRDPQA